MKKNTNRTSIIKGQIIDAQEFKFEAFEIETEYTRSTFKAAQLVADAMNLDAGRYMVHVTEIINEPAKRIEYDPQSLIENATCIFDNENEAEPLANQSVIEYVIYTYSAQVWAFNGETYVTEYHEYDCTVKLGKVDARAAVVMNYEKEHDGFKCIGIHNDKREQFKRYALIDNEALENVKTK